MEAEKQGLSPKLYRESLLKNVTSRVCKLEWLGDEQEGVTKGYGVGIDFAKVLDPYDGINMDMPNLICPKFMLSEKGQGEAYASIQENAYCEVNGKTIKLFFHGEETEANLGTTGANRDL